VALELASACRSGSEERRTDVYWKNVARAFVAAFRRLRANDAFRSTRLRARDSFLHEQHLPLACDWRCVHLRLVEHGCLAFCEAIELVSKKRAAFLAEGIERAGDAKSTSAGPRSRHSAR
jgi:hypothetical protein